MSESLRSFDMGDKGLDQSTMALTISNISMHQSENVFDYDEEFTLNPAPKEQVVRERKNCLAMRIAQTFPKRIKQEVVKIVNYYENSVEQHYRQYHRLVEENAKIKRENQKLRAQAMSNELMAEFRFPISSKKPLEPIEVNTPVPSPDENLKLRVHQLQNKVISRDRKINELNSELSDLMIKLKKYKKKGEASLLQK